MTLAWEINVPFLLLLFHMRVCISTFVNVVVLYRIRSGQSQNGIYDQGRRRRSGCTVLTGPLFITEAFFNYIIVYSCTTSLRVRAQSVMR